MTFDWVGSLAFAAVMASACTIPLTIISACEEKWRMSALLFVITVFLWGVVGGVSGV